MFGKLVPVPSGAVIPERDIGKRPILNCINLGVTFGGLKAVDDFNLMIGRTEIAGLIGPNGAGKTTVFNLLTKVYQSTRGSIMIDGIDTQGMTTAQVNRLGVARTFQNIRLFDNLSVEDNVKLGMHNQIKYGMVSGILRLPAYWQQERIAHERALELLSIFDMQDLAGAKAGSLPYGAQRRLEIMRALATSPKLLLLDEHTAALDPGTAKKVLELSDKIISDNKLTALMITHNMTDAIRHGNRLIMMDRGKIVLDISGEEKSRLTKADLLERFAEKAGVQEETDSVLLS